MEALTIPKRPKSGQKLEVSRYNRIVSIGFCAIAIPVLVLFLFVIKYNPQYLVPNLIIIAFPCLVLVGIWRKKMLLAGCLIVLMLEGAAFYELSIDAATGAMNHGVIFVLAIAMLLFVMPRKTILPLSLGTVVIYALVQGGVVFTNSFEPAGFGMVLGVMIVLTLLLWLERKEFDLRLEEKDEAQQALQVALAEAQKARDEALAAKAEAEQARDEERRQRSIAEEALRIREEFIGMFSHELRTPLGQVRSPLQMLWRTLKKKLDLTVEQAEVIKGETNSIIRAVDRLLDIVVGILELSRLRSGRFEFNPTQMKIGQLVEIAESFRQQAEEKGLSFKVEAGGEQTFRTDPTMVGSILRNLLGNAIKYTKEGRVAVSLLSGKRLVFQVTDTGIGISPVSLAHIFDEFYRDPEAKMLVEGTGVGLSTAKAFAEAAGGTIKVQSSEGKGSIFTVELPSE